uniref:Small ribosomal subunit protein uS7 domain-containing protein n=1 Tax=Percolomonas cosmopolitus TaxID=63605 RepID=A0A7S1KLQ5_9EUKA|eukprot:CAMPEP_0117442470 /NCGR_PEP_ID=MMETSP0759-20121206/4168_1 /TAXON_ID=63605 /ORGANISM="Percolomonas cosmopolitus, Strain WS" /LENGTH=192 /DNA_ID=CAMNT_0005234359 /DNA_START=113 /DNA_END=691 /DNA_ORIENTATION=-
MSSPADIKLFGKWSFDEVNVKDVSLVDYINVVDQRYLPHSSGRWATRRFKKARCPIVERLTNALMMKGRGNGKKVMAVRHVKNTFELIHIITGLNPLQVFVDAVSVAGPREDATRIGSGGVVRRQAVDVAPLRRINVAIALITKGARLSSFRSIKSFPECLADEIIAAAGKTQNSFAFRKREEIERSAASNR